MGTMAGSNQLEILPGRRRLSRGRIIFALAVAVVIDALQWPTLGLFEPLVVLLDIVGMVLTMWALGFHMLLLPTFVIKLIPIADLPPTWTVCVIAVVALRKRAERVEREAQETYRAVPPKLTDKT
jgi:hypothetical protein